MAAQCDHDIHDCAGWQQAQKRMGVWPAESGFVAGLDCGKFCMGLTANECGAMGFICAQSFEVEDSGMIRIFAGYDPNEAAGYHTFCHSVITRASEPVSITPIAKNMFSWWKREGENSGATEFSYSRFLVPYLCGYNGHAIFMDGSDMLCLGDVAELWALRDHSKAVQVVQHPEYEPAAVKMWGQANRAYPRKNWSSVMIMNCAYHHAHELTPENVSSKPGSWLHQFEWTTDKRIGGLPPEWNVLVGETAWRAPVGPSPYLAPEPKLLHFTLGLPDLHPTNNSPADHYWRDERAAMNHVR